MLERIEEIQGIGLLHDVKGKQFRLNKATLIYADNGRGKSTLATIMRSLSTGESHSINERKTIDGIIAPKATLQFTNGHKVTFINGLWTEQRPEILVFDADFIEKNVHSGGTVSPNHRKNLLEFALGASAVSARKAEELATNEASVANSLVENLTAQLAGYHTGFSLANFENLTASPEADAEIESLQKRIVSANNIDAVLARPVPSPAREPNLDLNALFAILTKSLDDVQDDAEKLVRNHINVLGTDGAEAWLSSGQIFDNGSDCPYCGQDTSAIALVRAYRTHFNTAYSELKEQVSLLERGVFVRTGTEILDAFSAEIATANAITSAWSAEIDAQAITFDRDKAGVLLAELQQHLLILVNKKLSNPTISAANPEDKKTAEALWNGMLALCSESNRQLELINSAIENVQRSLAKENAAQLQAEITRIQTSKRRFEPTVIDLLDKLKRAKLEANDAKRKKKKARDDLENLMIQTLTKFETSINELLIRFGAAFQIEKMDANFRGAPRSEYGLHLRGKSVPLEGNNARFSTVLSEGDKRTLAFAFFIATTLADSELKNRIIVIDDPMCSLDANRKHHTKNVLKKIQTEADQLIVLAHDPYFIRDLRDELTPKDGQSQATLLQLRHTSNDYTELSSLDIDKECESAYYRHHRMLYEYYTQGMHDPREVAKAIRLLLEGYLHRRFPGLVPRDQMFGQVVAHIRDAIAPNPLIFGQHLVAELLEINSYAGQFHHDTNPGNADMIQVVATELKTFCLRALNVVHKGAV